jgi:hypothetical protein
MNDSIREAKRMILQTYRSFCTNLSTEEISPLKRNIFCYLFYLLEHSQVGFQTCLYI